MRTDQEIKAEISEIRQAYEELLQESPEAANIMKDGFFGQMQSLYWVLGYSRGDAIDITNVFFVSKSLDRD